MAACTLSWSNGSPRFRNKLCAAVIIRFCGPAALIATSLPAERQFEMNTNKASS
jgi:hypothetical protein